MGASASVIQEYYKAVDYWADIAGKKDWKLAIWIVGRNDVDLVDKFLEIERSPVGQFDDIFFRFDTPYRGDDDEYAAQLWQEYAGWFEEQAEEKDDMLKALRHDGLLKTEYRPDTSAEPTAANLWKEMLRFKECISRLENAFFCIYFPPEQSGEFPRTEWFGQVLKEGVPQGIRLTTIDLKKNRSVALDESPEVVHIRPRFEMAAALHNRMARADAGNDLIAPENRFKQQVTAVMDCTRKQDLKPLEKEIRKLLDIAGELKDANIRISALFIASEACYAIRESWVRDNTGLEVQRTFSGGVTVRTERDCFGREVHKSVRSGGMEKGAYRYQWGIANRLLSKENELTGTVTRYDYDRFDFLIRQETMQGSETDVIYRTPDFVGNLFETPDKKDRKYGAGGKLLEDPDCFYHYDDEGNLIFREFKQLLETGVRFDRKRMEKEQGIRCLATGTGWLYEWSSNGMLKKVIRPDGRPVEFRYDALGRRTAKQYFGKVTRWVWDGNVPIHEWSYKVTDRQSNEEEGSLLKEPTEDITTWVFEAGTFVPTAKIQEGKQYSIVSDYLGTPIQMYDEQGNKTWDCTLNICGIVTTFDGCSLNDCPFKFQGQYADEETGLYYNRFRYYDSLMNCYISQDPIRLAGSNPTFYGYVENTNKWIDIWGLTVVEGQVGTYGALSKASDRLDGLQIHHIPQDKLGHLPRNEGIAIVMTDADHAKTRTFKTKGRVTAAIDQNRAFKDVLKDDLIDLHKIGGGKFDNSIQQIISEYENIGKLKKGELSLDIVKNSCH